MPAAFGTKLANRKREPRERMGLRSRHISGQGADVELNIRRLGLGQNPREQATLVDAYRQGAAARKEPLQADSRPADKRVQRVVRRDGLRAAIEEAELEVILQ